MKTQALSNLNSNITYENNTSNSLLDCTYKIVKISYDIFSVVFFPLGLCRLGMYVMHRALGVIIIQRNPYEDVVKNIEKNEFIKRDKIIDLIKNKFKSHFDKVEEVNISSFDKTNLNNMVFKKIIRSILACFVR